MTIQAVGFDLDGTLFDHRGAARTGAARFLGDLGVELSRPVLDRWLRAEDAQFERWRSGEISFPEQRRERLRTVLPAVGVAVPADPDALDALFEQYRRAYRAAWRPFPDALPLLHELRAAGHRIGLLTNGTEEQQLDKLAVTGLAGAFDVVCVSERIGHAKPDPAAFRALAEGLGVHPSDCLFVGDDARLDVAGARAAGMAAVLVDPGVDAEHSDADSMRDRVLAALADT